MKRLLLLFFILLSISAKAHNTDPETNTDKTGTISGRVLDANLKQPLPYVNVIIKNTKDETLTGGITLEDGTFEIEKIAGYKPPRATFDCHEYLKHCHASPDYRAGN